MPVYFPGSFYHLFWFRKSEIENYLHTILRTLSFQKPFWFELFFISPPIYGNASISLSFCHTSENYGIVFSIRWFVRWCHFDWIRLTFLHFFVDQRIDFVHGSTLHWFLSTNVNEIDFDSETKIHSMTSSRQLRNVKEN